MSDLRALLLTDIVDSTRVAEGLGDAAMAAHWAAHDRAAHDLLRTWRGREIEKTDGLLAVFDSAADAVAFALAYHRAIAALGLPFMARAGVHVASFSVRESSADDIAAGAKRFDVDGLAKPVTARVMAATLGGQTLITADARLALGVTPLRVQSHGHWRLKGLPEPIELFEVGDAKSPFTPPPDEDKAYRVVRQGSVWLPVREVKHSVPAERDVFVNREEVQVDLARRFDEGARLVSVLGMGGTGKTRFITRFAWCWLGEFPGGVWFCDLSQARSVDGIVFAVAQGLDVPLGQTDPVVQLAHAIAGRGRCLVILDNFEQVARHAEETLGKWLDRAREACFAVTTREVLGISGEQTIALAPLAQGDAVTLLMRRAEAGGQGLGASAGERADIEQLVKLLDGLPLAIELAAARVRVMPVRSLLARMSERFAVLSSRGSRHDRQATLRATFDWSWDLLTEAEKAGLAQLSVFRGGFDMATVEAVLDLSQLVGAPWPMDLLQSLVDKSFVRRAGGERFDLLESVRDYAAEHLRTDGRFAGSGPLALLAAEARHAAFFSAAIVPGTPHWPHSELDNLIATCQRAVARGDGAVAVRALAGVWSVVELSGPFRVIDELAQRVRSSSTLPDGLAAELDFVHGSALDLCGRATEAQPLIAASAAGAASVGNTSLRSRALSTLAKLQAAQGRTNEAQASYELALRAARQAANGSLECRVLNNLGLFCEGMGRLAEAQTHYEAALRIARIARDRRWEGGSAGNLAQFYADQGKLADAKDLYAQAVAIARELGDHQWEAIARCNLGLLCHTEGRWADARAELQASLAAARDMGHARLLSIVPCNLGLVAEAMGEPDEALAHYTEGVHVARDLSDRRAEGQCLTYLGLLHARQQRPGQARECLVTGGELLEAVSDRVSLGVLWCARVEAAHLAGDAPGAAAAMVEAQGIEVELVSVQADSEFGQALRRVRHWERGAG